MKLLTSLFAFILMCVASRAAEDVGPTDFATHFYGSSENLEFILKAENVTASTLREPLNEDGKLDREKNYGRDMLKHYTVLKTLDVPLAVRDELRAILKDPATRSSNGPKGCVPIFGARFTFSHAGRTLTVNLCLSCKHLMTAENDVDIGGGLFDPAGERVLAIVKGLFPDDKGLKGLR